MTEAIFSLRYRQRTDDFGMDFHSHEGLELFQINEGQGHVFIRDQVYPFHAGDWFWINALDLHKVYVQPGSTYVRTAIYLRSDWTRIWSALYPEAGQLGSFFYRRDLPHRIDWDPGELAELELLIDSLHRDSLRAGWRGSIGGLLTISKIILLADNHFEHSGIKSTDMISRVSAVQRVMDYIEQHLAEPIRTEHMADYFHMNKSYLCQLFKEKTGVTISRYLMSRRVTLAKQYLISMQDKELKLQELARLCGFQEAPYLCRIFKQLTGETPKEYRKRWFSSMEIQSK